jgi:hypothetical protein
MDKFIPDFLKEKFTDKFNVNIGGTTIELSDNLLGINFSTFKIYNENTFFIDRDYDNFKKISRNN